MKVDHLIHVLKVSIVLNGVMLHYAGSVKSVIRLLLDLVFYTVRYIHFLEDPENKIGLLFVSSGAMTVTVLVNMLVLCF